MAPARLAHFGGPAVPGETLFGWLLFAHGCGVAQDSGRGLQLVPQSCGPIGRRDPTGELKARPTLAIPAARSGKCFEHCAGQK